MIKTFEEWCGEEGIKIEEVSANLLPTAYRVWGEECYYEAKELKSENAALRERLEKAVELPPGDRVWYIAEDEEGAESYIISKPTSSLAVEELKYEIGKKYFTTREAAEKRAELNGGKQ